MDKKFQKMKKIILITNIQQYITSTKFIWYMIAYRFRNYVEVSVHSNPDRVWKKNAYIPFPSIENANVH